MKIFYGSPNYILTEEHIFLDIRLPQVTASQEQSLHVMTQKEGTNVA